MAEALYLVTKDELGGAETFIDGVRAVVINKDDGQTDAQIIADAVSAANSANGTDAFYPAYFTTVTKISDLSAGPLKDNKDAYVLLPGGPVAVKVEGS